MRFLDEASEAGYEWIELGPFGYLPLDAGVLKQELARRNLRVTASGVMGHIEEAEDFARLEREALSGGALLQELGAHYFLLIDDTYTDIFTGHTNRASSLAGKDWDLLIDRSNYLGRLVLERFGLPLVFHPHVETHVQFEDQIETFLDQTDPRYVNLCLDTGHHAYCGGDPMRFFRRHSSRIPYLHIKSVDADKLKTVQETDLPFALAVQMGVFTEPSLGIVDFVAFKQSLDECAYVGWAIVEQDMFPAPFDKPLPIARRTRQYLKQIGLG
jgi:inosose dehydratase